MLGLNDSSTESEMKTANHSMVCRFHPDKNIGFDTTKMMTMINEAKDGLEDTLRTNDAIRGEEGVSAAEDAITLLYDDNYDSETRDTSSEPATSSNKASTFPAEHSTDNEETPLKKNSCWIMDIIFFKQSRVYILRVAAMQTMKIYTYCLQNGYTY